MRFNPARQLTPGNRRVPCGAQWPGAAALDVRLHQIFRPQTTNYGENKK